MEEKEGEEAEAQEEEDEGKVQVGAVPVIFSGNLEQLILRFKMQICGIAC